MPVQAPTNLAPKNEVTALAARLLAAKKQFEDASDAFDKSPQLAQFEARRKTLDDEYLARSAKITYGELSTDPEILRIDAKVGQIRDEQNKAYSAWIKFNAPIIVSETAFMCGNTIVDGDHTVNTNSFWTIRKAGQPPAEGLQIDGVQMHYLVVHGQASAALVAQLKNILGTGYEKPREVLRHYSGKPTWK